MAVFVHCKVLLNLIFSRSIITSTSHFVISATMKICCFCKTDPCLREVHRDVIRRTILTVDTSLNDSEQRKVLYRAYTRAEHGYLGRGVREKAPQCVVELIRELIPNPEGKYMGHKWTYNDADNTDDGGDNNAYEGEVEIHGQKSSDNMKKSGKKYFLRLFWRFAEYKNAAMVAADYVATLPNSDDWIVGFDEKESSCSIVVMNKSQYDMILNFCVSKMDQFSGIDSETIE